MNQRIRTLLITACLLIAGLTLPGCHGPADAPATQEPLKVMFLYGAPSHASGAHEFRAGAMLLADQLNRQDAVAIQAQTHAGWPEDERILDEMDAVIIYADGTKVIRHGFEKMDALVKQGTGVMMMHYAVHPSIEQGEKYFLPWMGGYFENGHSVNPIWSATIKPLDRHQVARGVDSFTVKDEFYYNLKYAKNMIPLGVATPTAENLYRINNLWTQSGYEAVGTPQPLLWGYEHAGGGRGAGFTGGHYHRNWAVEDFRQIVMNTIVWIARGEVPRGGVPTTPITEEDLNRNLDKKNQMVRVTAPQPCDCQFKPGYLLTPAQHKAGAKRRPAE